MKAGYVRGTYSPAEVKRILDAFAKASCDQVIFDESTHHSAVLDGLLQRLEDGDILVVWRLNCVASSLKDLIRFIRNLTDDGIGFESLTESFKASGESIMPTIELLEKVACFDTPIVDFKAQVALRRTRRSGRPRALGEKDVERAQTRVLEQGQPVDAVARDLGVSRATLYRYLDLVRQ